MAAGVSSLCLSVLVGVVAGVSSLCLSVLAGLVSLGGVGGYCMGLLSCGVGTMVLAVHDEFGCGEGVVNFLRNLLFLSVVLPEPSIFTRYWWNCFTSSTLPVRSHFVGKFPVWFWSQTWSPVLN